MKPILPKNAVNVKVLPQVCNVASPGTTFIITPPIIRGTLTESHQRVTLPMPIRSIQSKNPPQQTPVFLPLSNSKLNRVPLVLPKLDNMPQHKAEVPISKSYKFTKGRNIKEKGNDVSNLNKTGVKNILPKVSQDTHALLIIPPQIPAYLPKPTLSVSSSTSSTIATQTATVNKCKIILKKKNNFGAVEHRNPVKLDRKQINVSLKRDYNKNEVNDGKLCYSKILLKRSRQKNLKNGNFIETKAKDKLENNNRIQKFIDNAEEKSEARSNKIKKGSNKNIDSLRKYIENSESYVISERITKISNEKTVKLNESNLQDALKKTLESKEIDYQEGLPSHPPPPYPRLPVEKSYDKINEFCKVDDVLVHQLSTKNTSASRKLSREKDVNFPPSSDTDNAFSNVSMCKPRYNLCNSSMPSSEVLTYPTGEEFATGTSNTLMNKLNEMPQHPVPSDVIQELVSSPTTCDYKGETHESFGNTNFTKPSTSFIEPPLYSSSPLSEKFSSPSSSHVSSSHAGNYDPSPYPHSISPSDNSRFLSQDSNSKNAIFGTNHEQLFLSSHTGVLKSLRRIKTGENIRPTGSPLISMTSNTATTHSYLSQECNQLYTDKMEMYPSSPDATQLPNSSQPSFISSHHPSPYNSLTSVSYMESPQTNINPSIQSPHPNLYNTSSHAPIYGMSPYAATYTESPLQSFISSSPQPSSSSHSHQQLPYGPSQNLSSSISSLNRVDSQSPRSQQHSVSQSFCDSPHPDNYCQSPVDSPVSIRHCGSNKNCQVPLLPPYTYPHLPSTSQHATKSSYWQENDYSQHQNTIQDHCDFEFNKSVYPTYESYSDDKFNIENSKKSLSPPSYEAHFQSSLSFPTGDHSVPNTSHYLQQHPSNRENSSRYQESQYDERDINVDSNSRSVMKSPPAYPTTATPSLPLPLPQYMAEQQSVSGCHNLNYPFTPEICNDSQENSVLEHTGSFFPDTPMLPPPAAPPPHQNLGDNNSALYSDSTYLHHSYDNQELTAHRQTRETEHRIQSLHKMYYNETKSNMSRGQNPENSKVNDLLEKAERLWFIPHQEQNRIYMKRRELAKNILNHPVSKTSRDTLKEKFWIEEDEPISADILRLPQGENNDSKDNQLTTGKLLSDAHAFSCSNTKLKNRNMLCQYCGKILKGRNSLKSHLNSHLGIKPHACPYCSKSFSHRSILVQHLRIHTEEKPYVCPVCGNSFRSRSGLVRHKSMHTDARPFECSMCSKAFKTKLVLQQHLKLHLTGLFTCSVCNRTFERHKSLVAHKASHTHNTKRYRCTHCSKGYRFRSLLNHHMQMHANIRKHICPVCSEAFVWRSGLVAHMKTHSTTRPKCHICSACFPSEKRLATHLKRHANKKPHTCEVCGHSFAYAYRLASHRIVHREKQEFPCTRCSKVFYSIKRLDKHLSNHKEKENKVNKSSEEGSCQVVKGS